MTVRATDAGIQNLYHYEAFNPAYLEDTLVNQRVHFSNPKNFNDPWDCNLWFDTTRVNDPVYRASCIEVLRQSPIPNLNAAQQSRDEARMQADSSLLRALIEETTEATRNTIAERFRIYCLTPLSDNTLMWSHYSDKHKGICLEFDAGLEAFGGAWQVGYSDALPVLDILALAPTEYVFRILVSKSSDWRYENEY